MYRFVTAWIAAVATAALAAAATSEQALAQSDSTTARIYATISPGVAINDTNEMIFGWMARPASPGLAQLSPANQIASAGLTLMKGAGSSPATIVISGSPNQALGLLVGERARFGGAAQKISVSGFTHSGGPMPALGPDGRAKIELGATLYVMTNAKDGRYRGVFDVIVTNN